MAIDKLQLDIEWEKLVVDSEELHKAYAKALFARDKAKERINIAYAKLDEDIRFNPQSYGFDKKPTEVAIKNAIEVEEDYRKEINTQHELNLELNIIKGGISTLNDRKEAIKGLQELFMSGYYTRETIPVKEVTKSKVKKELSKKMKERRIK